MKAVIQRVKHANVKVDGELINEIAKGYLIFLGIHTEDTSQDVKTIANKILKLRIFDDENGIMNKNIMDSGGEILSISQFTLQGNTRKGNRPSYLNAMRGEDAEVLYKEFNELLNKEVKTYEGVFGGDMKVSLLNDGPITIILDTKE